MEFKSEIEWIIKQIDLSNSVVFLIAKSKIMLKIVLPGKQRMPSLEGGDISCQIISFIVSVETDSMGAIQ